jgi:hypothetical protein
MKKCEDAEESTKEETEAQKSTEALRSGHMEQQPSPDTTHLPSTPLLQKDAAHSMNGR